MLIKRKYKNQSNWWLILVAGLIFLSGVLVGRQVLAPHSVPDRFYQVIEVIDGDTFKVENGRKVRLLGIDAPEKDKCYYAQAKQALKDLVEQRLVILEKDITEQDKYGRWLRYIILPVEGKDNLLVNEYLVRRGYAWSISSSPDRRYRNLLAAAEQEAKKKQRGLWGECNYERENKLRQLDVKPDNPRCIIKGNISEKGYGKTYLVPGCDNYERVKIDPRRGERYFCSQAEAQAAGFRKAENCP